MTDRLLYAISSRISNRYNFGLIRNPMTPPFVQYKCIVVWDA